MRRAFFSPDLKGFKTGFLACIEKNNMVGERHKREPKDEAQKWHRRSKVWDFIKKGEITNFIDQLHGWKSSVTKTMVRARIRKL